MCSFPYWFRLHCSCFFEEEENLWIKVSLGRPPSIEEEANLRMLVPSSCWSLKRKQTVIWWGAIPSSCRRQLKVLTSSYELWWPKLIIPRKKMLNENWIWYRLHKVISTGLALWRSHLRFGKMCKWCFSIYAHVI